MRAWWSALFVPHRRIHLHSSSLCSLPCLDEPTRNSASGPLSLRMSRSFLEISSYAWSQEILFHLPSSSFIGYLRRCESCVTPCSRAEAPLAQCPPRLSGESNTGSCRVHTPFSTTASMAQPTEQCVHTVRRTSTLPLAAGASAASERPIMLNGSWVASAPAPTVNPDRLRNVRRSIVLARTPDTLRARRGWATAVAADFLVSSMAPSSNLGGAVVVIDVLRGLVAAGRALAGTGRDLRGGRRTLHRDRNRSRRAAGTDGKKEVTP